MSNNRRRELPRKNILTAKLTFQDLAENQLYRIIGKTTEKEKGLAMSDLIDQQFNLTEQDRRDFRQKMIQMQMEAFTPTPWKHRKKVEWTRDDKGNIASPFRTKKQWKDL